MNKRAKSWLIWILILSILLVLAALFSLVLGAGKIPLSKIISLLLHHPQGKDSGYIILFYVRLPRIILALAAGGALSIAGVIFQGMFRNPLVEPYTLGVSGGAALGVTLSIILGLTLIAPLTGFAGAALAIWLVYFLASRRGGLRIPTLLLIGVMLSFISSALITLIVSLARVEKLHTILFWVMGSLEEGNLSLIRIVVALSLLGAIFSFFFSLELNALSLGEEEALHLGINIERTKTILFIIASLVTGVVVSITGIIGFVGLVVPHFMRMLVGPDHRILLPTSFLGGGIFLLLCDTLARTVIQPLELPVGVITGVIGGSIFIYFLSKKELVLGGK